jgi:hypothetical protein
MDERRHDSEKKPVKRRITFFRLFVCGVGAAFTGVGVFILLAHVPMTALAIVFGLIGLVLLFSAALASNKTCEQVAEAITHDYESS